MRGSTALNILVVHWLPRNYGYANQPLPWAAPSGLVSLFAIIPWLPVNKYNLSGVGAIAARAAMATSLLLGANVNELLSIYHMVVKCLCILQ